jgi:subfamily B ATP-binding cassette protein MsbA
VAALKIMSPIKSISQFPASWAIAVTSAERVFGILDEPAAEVDAPGARPATFDREIAFDRVSFAYEPGTPVLRDVSFTVPKGSVTAIVGPSGSGKTTLLELLPRFHDPTSGDIRLDGVELTQVAAGLAPVVDGRGESGHHPAQRYGARQHLLRASRSRTPPRWNRRRAPRTPMISSPSCRRAMTPCSASGVPGFPGGQRQRIAIARALMR